MEARQSQRKGLRIVREIHADEMGTLVVKGVFTGKMGMIRRIVRRRHHEVRMIIGTVLYFSMTILFGRTFMPINVIKSDPGE
jgi:hypothetical protein